MSAVKFKKSSIKLEYRHILHTKDNLLKHIEITPNIMDGIPVIKGTRIPVYVILEMLSGGYPITRIQKEFPRLSMEDILAALRFASLLASWH